MPGLPSAVADRILYPGGEHVACRQFAVQPFFHVEGDRSAFLPILTIRFARVVFRSMGLQFYQMDLPNHSGIRSRPAAVRVRDERRSILLN